MATEMIEELYAQYIEPLQPEDQRQLLALIKQRLVGQAHITDKTEQHSIMELEGLGAEIWEGVDAQEYVNQLRAEWDHRP